MTTARTPERPTTGIGSLPHHNVDAALDFSFRFGIPFLPQIPIRNPWEYMIAQALEGLPGLQVDADGTTRIDPDVWYGRAHAFKEKLLSAFANAQSRPDAFDAFEPGAATSSGWHPFLWELEERGTTTAKVQIAGPLTSQWALRLQDGSHIDHHPDLSNQIYRLVLARAIAMVRRLSGSGIKPLIYLDEPGLYGLSLSHPKHLLGLQELKLMVQTLRKEEAWVGVHCCSNTNWKAVLGLGLNLVSIDTHLSLDSLLSSGAEAREFIRSGGRFSLGVIPTNQPHGARSMDPQTILFEILGSFENHWKDEPELVRKALKSAVFTPACGLALQTVEDSEIIVQMLQEFSDLTLKTLSS